MKIIFKRVFTPLVLSVILGSLCGKIFYGIYSDELEDKFNSDKIYLLESGAYKSYDSMKKNNYDYNYLYYKDGDIYKSIIGITKKYDNIEKIRSIYPNELVVKEYFVSNDEIIKKQEEYDNMLFNEKDESEEWDIINDIINLYKESEETKLFYME